MTKPARTNRQRWIYPGGLSHKSGLDIYIITLSLSLATPQKTAHARRVSSAKHALLPFLQTKGFYLVCMHRTVCAINFKAVDYMPNLRMATR